MLLCLNETILRVSAGNHLPGLENKDAGPSVSESHVAALSPPVRTA